MYEKESKQQMARRTAMHGGVVYRDRVEDLSKVDFNQHPYIVGETEGNNLARVLANAGARRDAFLKTFGEDFERRPVGERGRISVNIHMLVLADELKVAGYIHISERTNKKD